ncbi:MAG: prepilin-type N-terminal cleavage/methylation domain-containing protein [bacterium]
MTLIEVVVVIAIVGIIASVSALAIPRVVAPPPTDPARVFAQARRDALKNGTPTTARLLIDSVVHEVVVSPDGSVVADSVVPIDRFSAQWRHAQQ